jgi:hypothetical protein
MDYKVVFNKPYQFEGQEYNEVDLAGLENLKASDLAEADKAFIASGQVAMVNEMSIGYACIIAARASAKPVEFFTGLPAKDAISVKSVVTNFLFE